MPRVEYLLTASPRGRLRVAYALEGRTGQYDRLRPLQYQTNSAGDSRLFADLLFAERRIPSLVRRLDHLIPAEIPGHDQLTFDSAILGELPEKNGLSVFDPHYGEKTAPAGYREAPASLAEQISEGLAMKERLWGDIAAAPGAHMEFRVFYGTKQQQPAHHADWFKLSHAADSEALEPIPDVLTERTERFARVPDPQPMGAEKPDAVACLYEVEAVADRSPTDTKLFGEMAAAAPKAQVAGELLGTVQSDAAPAQANVMESLAASDTGSTESILDAQLTQAEKARMDTVLDGELIEASDSETEGLLPGTNHLAVPSSHPTDAYLPETDYLAVPAAHQGHAAWPETDQLAAPNPHGGEVVGLPALADHDQMPGVVAKETVLGESADEGTLFGDAVQLASLDQRLARIEQMFTAEQESRQGFVLSSIQHAVRELHGIVQDGVIAGGYVDILIPDDIPEMTGIDYLNPPETDYPFSPERVYDLTTGEPYYPVGDTTRPMVQVAFPDFPPFPEHEDAGRIPAGVPLELYQAFLEAILVFWGKQYERLLGEGADVVMSLILEHLWDTFVGPYQTERAERERLYRFVRWYAEEAMMKHITITLDRRYLPWNDPVTEETWVDISPNQPYRVAVSGKIWGELQWTQIGPTELRTECYMDGQPVRISASGGIWSVPAPPGEHEFLIRANTKGQIRGVKRTNVVFDSAMIHPCFFGSSGSEAVQYLVRRLLEYWRLHHEDKDKGTRDIWNLDEPLR